jgi:hypothetical protein
MRTRAPRWPARLLRGTDLTSLSCFGLGTFIFFTLCVPFFSQASFIHEDYLNIYYLPGDTYADIWLRAPSPEAPPRLSTSVDFVYYRPVTLTAFKALMALTNRPALFQIVTAVVIFVGVICLYLLVAHLSDRWRTAHGFGMDFVLLCALVPMSPPAGLCITWITAAYHESFVFGLTAVALYCAAVRDRCPVSPGQRTALNAAIGASPFLSVCAKENGALTFAGVVLLSLLFGMQAGSGRVSPRMLWRRAAFALRANWFLFPVGIAYCVLRFYVADVSLPLRRVSEPFIPARVKEFLSLIPEGLFDRSVSGWLYGLFVAFYGLVLPALLVRARQIPSLLFVYVSAIATLLPAFIAYGWGANQFSQLGLYLFMGLVMFMRSIQPGAEAKGATGRVLLIALTVAGLVGFEQSYAARLSHATEFREEFNRFYHAIIPHALPIEQALRQKRRIEARDFPSFKTSEPFFAAVFFAATGETFAPPQLGTPPREPPLILLNRGNPLLPEVAIVER